MMAGEAYSFISSRLVKEVFGLGGNISGLVPPSVEARLQHRIVETEIERSVIATTCNGSRKHESRNGSLPSACPPP